MKNFRNFIFALSVVLGISAIESEGIYFWIALAMCFVPFAVLGIEELRKQKAYEEAKQKSNNIDYLLDVVEFGEWEMN